MIRFTNTLLILFVFALCSNIQAQCLSGQSSSISPLGPYTSGDVVIVTYTLNDFDGASGNNWVIAFDIGYGAGWSSISPVSAPGNPGGSNGNWIWDVQNTYPNGFNFGPGYRFQNNGNANWGTSSDGPFTLSFELTVGCVTVSENLFVDITVYGDCETGGWNNGCCSDPSLTYSIYNGNSIPSNPISISANPIDMSCFAVSDGSISLNISSGISPFTYSWSNGATTASANNLGAGSYDVIVTDAVGCTADLNIIINEPLEIQISSNISPLSCYGFSDGGISLNISSGISPFTYSWSNGATTASANNLGAGSYDVIVTDAVGCTADLNIIINEPLEIQISSNISPLSCYGFSDGGISLNISSGISPFTYSWSNGATTASANNLGAGSYDVIVTDAVGCIATLNTIINEASSLVYVLNTNDATCFGSLDGNACINLLGSPTPVGTVSLLSYCASNPAPALTGQASTIIEEVQLIGDNNDIYNNTSGISDFYEDYTTTMYADITEGLTYSLNIAINDMSGTGSYPGGARVFIDFNIDGDFTDIGEDIGIVAAPATLGALIPITFTVPSTGVYGATRMRIVCQDENSLLTYGITSADIGPCDSPIGFNLPYFGATEDYSIVLNSPNISATYLWSTSQITDSIYGLSAGTYSIIITDDNGCLTTDSFTISSSSLITVSADFDQSQCQGIIPDSLFALGSTSGNNYSWYPSSNFINSNIQNPVFSNPLIATTTFTVSFTDLNGCVATDDITITVLPIVNTSPINHN